METTSEQREQEKERHSRTLVRVWAAGDTYTVCEGCGGQVNPDMPAGHPMRSCFTARLCRDVATALGEKAVAVEAVEDIWPFVGHRRRCASQISQEVGEGADCDCGLREALHRGNVKKAREARAVLDSDGTKEGDARKLAPAPATE